MTDKRIYLLPGRGEKLGDNLGRAIVRLGYAIQGRGVIADFACLRFSEQLATIRSDLQAAFWHPEARVVARSYGAYLLLNSLAEMNPFLGRILLLSPVLGAAVANNGFYVSRPPRAERFAQLVKACKFPPPQYLEIHTGAEDNGCDPSLAKRFASLLGNTKLNIVAGVGHELGKEYTRGVLRGFLRDGNGHLE